MRVLVMELPSESSFKSPFLISKAACHHVYLDVMSAYACSYCMPVFYRSAGVNANTCVSFCKKLFNG